jgi:hypothetical protein
VPSVTCERGRAAHCWSSRLWFMSGGPETWIAPPPILTSSSLSGFRGQGCDSEFGSIWLFSGVLSPGPGDIGGVGHCLTSSLQCLWRYLQRAFLLSSTFPSQSPAQPLAGIWHKSHLPALSEDFPLWKNPGEMGGDGWTQGTPGNGQRTVSLREGWS